MSRQRPSIVLALLAFVIVLWIAVGTPSHAQAIFPDGVVFVDNATVLPLGNHSYVIQLQVTIRGGNYSGNSFGIYVSSSNPGVLNIPEGTTIVTDERGRASLNVTTGQSAGTTVVTAAMLSPDGKVRASKLYTIMGFGDVSGVIVDANGQAVPGANVTLYSEKNETSGTIAQLPGNPAITAGELSAVPGTFAIDNVPYGSYYLEADIDNHAAGVNLSVAHPVENVTVALANYTVPTPTPTPTPVPTSTPSPTPTPVPAGPSPTAKAPTGDSSRQLVGILAVALVVAILIIGVQVLRQRKRKK